MLYGSSPFADTNADELDLQSAMTVSSKIIAVQTVKASDGVGYGYTFRADRPMRVGVVAGGYADGYPRHAPTGTPILVKGKRTRVIGRVSMDMLHVDLTGIEDAGVGSPVTLWGKGISVDEVAHAAGTVGYELLCAAAARMPKVT
jgi:alanine racemase